MPFTAGLSGERGATIVGFWARLHLPTSGAGQVGLVATVLVVAVGLGLGTVYGAPAVLASLNLAANPVRTVPPPAPVLPEPALHAPDGQAPIPTEAGVATAIDRLAAAPALGSLAGVVLDVATASPLWQRQPAVPLVPGSTAKIATAAAALLALDPALTLETTVVAGPKPGTVVLVGGGDPTLSTLPAGKESVYPGAPRLDELVQQVRAAAPDGVDTVLVDVGRYRGDSLGPGWLPADIPGGYIAPIVPVMLDGGRGVPTEQDTPRTGTPALAAAAELARRLGANPATVAVGTAPPQARVLGRVASRPVRELTIHMMLHSDNVLAEVLAHEVALATGAEPSFTGAAAALRTVLTTAGLEVTGLNLVDGSGLSALNKVTARGLASVLAAAAAPGTDPRAVKLRPLLAGLPVAGGSGTLAGRYDGAADRAGRGYVRAKTGTLDNVSSLAGIVLDADGRLLAFALVSNGATSSATARPALDAIAAGLATCGCR